MSIELVLVLERFNRIYYENDALVGKVVVNCKSSEKHDGLYMCLDGTVNLQLSNKSVGIFEAFYNSVKPVPLILKQVELLPPGKLNAGITEIPFSFPLKSQRANKPLYETYHGVFVNISYILKCELKRSFLAKTVSKEQEFIILSRPVERPPSKEVKFSITPDTLRKNARERIQIPRFQITGKLNDTIACITKPLTGHLTIQHSEVPIKSIDIQLIRVETCGCAEGYSRDATEIQNIQIADGNVATGVNIPIHMIFPRLFSCPTLLTENNFKVEFELNLIVIFKDEYLVTENFQLNLIRCEC